jgi:hypothetical protein
MASLQIGRGFQGEKKAVPIFRNIMLSDSDIGNWKNTQPANDDRLVAGEVAG